MLNPVSTYRIQFHKNFTFKDFDQILPYLQKLGVKTVYASPIFESTPGSTHGYDGLNPHRINPEIGTLEELYALRKKLRDAGMFWLQDIVPNHAAFDPRNPWLYDVLEKGRHSPYAVYFDIDWEHPLSKGQLMVPFLGSSFEEALSKGELKITYQKQRLVFSYYDSSYPLGLQSYAFLLNSPDVKNSEPITAFLETVTSAQEQKNPKAYTE